MRSSLKELWSRVVKTVDKEDIYVNGHDNAYPQRVELVVDNSVTAKMAANKMAAFVIGKGPSEDFQVNPAKGLSLYDIVKRSARSMAYHRGFFLHLNYDIEGNVNYMDVLPFKNCRIAKEDDQGYPGLVYYSDEWEDKGGFSSRKKKDRRFFYPYNPKKQVIDEQRRKDAGDTADLEQLMKKYRGQVMYVNLEPERIYPLAYVDSVYNDADSEYRASVFKNTTLRNGFIGKIVANLVGSDTEKDTQSNESNLEALMGAHNTGGLLTFRTELGEDGKPIEAVSFTTVDSNIDDKMFSYTEASTMEKILMAYNNIPKQLVMVGDGALFGASGDALREMKLYYQNETEVERTTLENALSNALGRIITIKPLIDEGEFTDIEE